MKKRCMAIILVFFILITSFSFATYADEEQNTKYRLGELYNTGKDNGYSKRKSIDKDDPHYNWEMGEFYVSGFTRQMIDEDIPVFLKNSGDEVILWFDLKQDIKALNGNEKLYVCDDKNGYEETYQVEKQNLKKGALIIKHTDYQNKDGLSQVHIDYLSANVSEKADTKVLLCEEGDYEVSLLYEIKNDNFLFFDSYENYRIDFKFSVRNGNAMVFPRDVITKEELTNSVFTENGFYIDLANSRYLNVDVKREVWNEGVDGLVEDTRYNRPAADGDEFTEEGIYTITVTNQYTNVTTEKKIYVGSNSVLKAHIVTGLPIKDIQNQIADNKATIDDNGNIVLLESSKESASADNKSQTNNNVILNSEIIIIVSIVAATLIIAATITLILVRKKRVIKNRTVSLDNEDK